MDALKNAIPIVLSIASFALSLVTIWLTQFRRGRLKMTQPALLCLLRERPDGLYKLFLRTLMYSTASKGIAVETMFAIIKTKYGTYRFDFWGHTEAGKLTLGSGLYVGPAGVCADHHFNPRRHTNEFIFCDGDYYIQIFAKTVGVKNVIKLKELIFSIDGQQAAELIQITDTELYVYWNAETQKYETQLRRRNEAFPAVSSELPSWFIRSGEQIPDSGLL